MAKQIKKIESLPNKEVSVLEAQGAPEECGCIKEVENMIIGQLHQARKILKAKFKSVALRFVNNKGMVQACGMLEASLEGRKTPTQITIIYTFCPFCGKAYQDKEIKSKENSGS